MWLVWDDCVSDNFLRYDDLILISLLNQILCILLLQSYEIKIRHSIFNKILFKTQFTTRLSVFILKLRASDVFEIRPHTENAVCSKAAFYTIFSLSNHNKETFRQKQL